MPAQKPRSKKPLRAAATERLNLRATRPQTDLLQEAAREMQTTLSAFIVESSCLRAEEVLASRQHFEIKPAGWNQFMAALDRPAQPKPGLRKLLTQPSVLERTR